MGKLLRRFVSSTDGIGTTITLSSLLLLLLTFIFGDKEWAKSLLSPEFIDALQYILVTIGTLFLARIKK